MAEEYYQGSQGAGSFVEKQHCPCTKSLRVNSLLAVTEQVRYMETMVHDNKIYILCIKAWLKY